MTDKIKGMISYFEDIARHPKKSVQMAMKETGKKAIGCFPYYTPEEIIYAGGMLPIGLWGGQTEIKLADKYLQSFCCSIMRANLEQGLKGEYDDLSAVLIPAYCDTMKCIIENWKAAVHHIPAVPMVYPNNRRIRAGIDFLISEFQRVKSEMERTAGRKITEEELGKSIDLYEEYRKTMREFTSVASEYPITFNAVKRHLIIKASYFSDKKIYVEKLKNLIKEVKKYPAENYEGIRAVITGILAEPEAFLEALTENNIAIAADDLAQESRQFRTSITCGATALEKLAIRMSNQECATLYDEAKGRGKKLTELTRSSNADVVIISMLKFCDPEEFDFPIYKKELKEAGIPMLYLEIEQTMNSAEQIRTRIQSLAEMIG